jgi:ribonuclease P protein component
MSERFPRSARVLRRPEFDAVFGEGRSRADDVLIVYARPRPEGGESRLGLVVGRKFGHAHLRNAFKRRVREAFRIHRGELPASHDFVVLPRGAGGVPEFDRIVSSLLRMGREAARVYEKRGPRR